MRACWKILATALCATLTITAANGVNAAEIVFSSRIDFTEIDLTIKDTYNANPDSITLEVTLSQDAQQRMTAASSAALEQDLTLIIDGKAVSTSRVRNIVDTPQIRIIMSRQAAMELLPALLGVNPVATPAANPQTAPIAAAAPAPAPTPADIPVPLLAAVPYAVETPQVTPLLPPEASTEAAVTPAPAMQEPDPAPAVPPDLTAMLADPPSSAPTAAPEPIVAPAEAAMPTPAAPEPIVAPAEAAMPTPAAPEPVVAPAEAAMPTPAAPEPIVAPAEAAMPTSAEVTTPAPIAVAVAAPPPQPALAIPAWALGAWLPTSATPSPYADINAGDPVAIFANAVDAITCNKARLSILESSNARVRLQLAPNSQCVISGVQVDRLQISPASTPGKIVISLYAAEDDMNGAPSKEGAYRRK
ncbi:hypothetical protein [Collimonas sp.]|jgi:hypothetical protein|uniref:hypothetical protein n=1 Tax=Collimonas sp. TaxID=1963772 RepID=UPI002D0E256E|nr:hypothetical protein [Collimonas sp.]HWW06740.1 hypothetical protein [Collimonas sp.]